MKLDKIQQFVYNNLFTIEIATWLAVIALVVFGT